jgi:RND superfamily putative drug exporter
MPEQRPAPRQTPPQAQPIDPPTTAIPTQRPQEPGATEKIATREASDDEPKRRGGGGVSASDLLRREGRL